MRERAAACSNAAAQKRHAEIINSTGSGEATLRRSGSADDVVRGDNTRCSHNLWVRKLLHVSATIFDFLFSSMLCRRPVRIDAVPVRVDVIRVRRERLCDAALVASQLFLGSPGLRTIVRFTVL
jgi:hypothetical protein